MAPPPLLQLAGIGLGFGTAPLFDALDLVVAPGERLALVGRNGSGKSTLMKIMAGLVEPDRGTRVTGPGVRVGYMEQDPDFAPFTTLGDFATADLDPAEHWRAEMAAEGVGLDLETQAATASGGERRRAALVRLIAAEPELMLLDEPTNHLDVAAIGWLEGHLAQSKAGIVVVSHDRAFLRAVARGVLWIDRGAVRRMQGGFEGFEAWRDTVWEEEDAARHKLDRLIKAEGRWAVEGISARRKRNQGRLRALAALRAERAAQIRRQGTAALGLEAGPQSGKRVIEAEGVCVARGGRTILRDVTLRVARGECIAIVGANGAGKTTLLRVLTAEMPADRGRVTLGSGVEIATFDQARAGIDPEATLQEALTGDPATRVPGRSDQVMVRGAPRHVMGYLRDFLFDESQARAPVRALSGGERARLLLARIMARPANVIVLDEPTNDLDIETLDLLQEVLSEFEGTVLLVSHDRDFIDRVATSTWVIEPDGRVTAYAGGWADATAQRGAPPVLARRTDAPPAPAPAPAPAAPTPAAEAPKAAPRPGASSLSFSERHRLAALPAEIDRLTAEVARLRGILAPPDLYARDRKAFDAASAALTRAEAALGAAEDEWLDLAARDEAGG
ncbi:MAG: ABC-F family ATP-binding cassette domain-containing protein [Gemmobacter sp.]